MIEPPRIDWIPIIEGATLFVTMIGGFATLWAKHVRLEFKTDIMWNSWMKQAQHSAEMTGLVQNHSPLKLTEKGRLLFSSVNKDADFLNFWTRHHNDKSVNQVAMMEKLIGDESLDKLRKEFKAPEIEIIISGIEYAKELSEVTP